MTKVDQELKLPLSYGHLRRLGSSAEGVGVTLAMYPPKYTSLEFRWSVPKDCPCNRRFPQLACRPVEVHDLRRKSGFPSAL